MVTELTVRLAEAEDTLRAIAAGEVDAFVVSDGDAGQRTFTLSTADRPYRMFVEHMREGAATVSSDGLVLFANQRLADLLRCPRQQVVGSSLSRFLADRRPIAPDALQRLAPEGRTVELQLLAVDGAVVPVLLGSSPLDVDGDLLACLTFTDLSEQKLQEREITRLGHAQAERLAELQQAQETLTLQATHDALTGLPNRALLVDRIEQALFHSRHTPRCDAVFYVDLDRFKQVNDSHGHAAGDDVLREVADQLVAALRPMDTVARIGGDEFVVLTPDLDDHVEAADLGQRLVAVLNDQPEREGDPEAIAASIGVSVSVGGERDAETLLEEADAAMYRAKATGGARLQIFDAALGKQAYERSIARRMLATALEEGRVVAQYQPIVDLPSGAVTGFEALARISAPDGGMLSPAAFIPAAEQSGLIVPLGTHMLELACQQSAGWSNSGPTPTQLSVAVNISARQFEPGNLLQVVERSLRDGLLDPRALHLELTETAIIDLRPDLIQQLGLITDLGVQVGLDDFGTGYASLTHLRRLPLTFVKIDQSFVQGLGSDHGDERIVAAVIDLAANLGLRSIAEGVETAEQMARLSALGCDQAQGYLIARPMPADEVPAALERSGRSVAPTV
jgi:diguanylate cyclase (GGDEF)-like protein/PAS domain S-box-containing protein